MLFELGTRTGHYRVYTRHDAKMPFFTPRSNCTPTAEFARGGLQLFTMKQLTFQRGRRAGDAPR
eukprot:5535392-Prymnesium_polylepis.1